MLKRLQRPTALLLTVLLPAGLALAACGGDDDERLSGFKAVSISGAAGEAPKLDWKGQMEPGKKQTKVLEEGDGPELAKDDQVLVNYLVGNGWTHKTAIDTYGDKAGGTLAKVGTPVEPQQIPDLLTRAVLDEIKPGMTIGTRLAVTVNSKDLISEYLGDASVSAYFAGLDIGNEDGLVVVADLVAKPLAAPDGAAAAKPAWAPKVVEKKGEPVSLDFTGTPKPGKKLQVASLVKGTGTPVKAGDVVAVNYLGQLQKAKAPFDESYSKDELFGAVISDDFGTVVKGWSKALVGVPVGSRVIMEIPPDLGYGATAQGEDIPANSTLYFVVDVLGVA